MSEQNNFGFDPIPLGSRPGADLSSMGLLPPLPKPAQPVEPRTAAPKPPEVPAAPVVKTAAIETAKPKPPLPGKFAWLPEATRMLFKPTRQKGVIAAGIASLACGALVANYMWPSPKPVVEVAKVEPAPSAAPMAPEAAPIPNVKTVVNIPDDVPAIPAPPIPTVIVPDPTPPTAAPSAPPLIVLPALPNEKKDEQVKPAGGVPEIPLPTIPQSPAPALPEVKLPETTAMLPPVKLPDLTPLVKSPPVPETKPAPPVVLPETKPAVPPVPSVVLPEVKPSAPPPPIDLTPPVVLPDAPKVESPRVDIAPPKIDVTPPPPAAIPEMKPAAPLPETPVKPAAGMAPREDYDVDVHYPKGGDTWTSISKDHLGDDRYAEALRAYNGGRALAANQGVDVPPIHVLRKNYPHLIAAPKAAAEPAPMKPAAGQRSYEVPAGGLSLKELARKALGDENLWGQIWELNPKLRADEPVPAGTKVKLPADARIGE